MWDVLSLHSRDHRSGGSTCCLMPRRRFPKGRTMMKQLLLTMGITGLAATQAGGQAACPLTYAIFELSVPHLDLKECPTGLARPGAFCRASTANDLVHVFVFAGDGDQCLLAVKSYKDGEYQLTVK
jgi:hypothetical protein